MFVLIYYKAYFLLNIADYISRPDFKFTFGIIVRVPATDPMARGKLNTILKYHLLRGGMIRI